MSNFWEELKRRNVFRETLGYLAAAWVLLEVGTVVLDTFDAPDWISQTLVILLAIGLPFWVLFSWAYQFTRKGIRRTSTDPSGYSATRQHKGSLILMFFIAVAVGAGLVFAFQGIGSKIREDAQYAIAVLPFRDLSPDKDNEWFCDGMASSIRNKLISVKNLDPAGMTSTYAYKDQSRPIREIAPELGADYVVVGEILSYPAMFVISVQLIDSDEKVVWSGEFQEANDNFFTVQQRVAREITRNLEVRITEAETGLMEAYGTENLEAFENFSKGDAILLQWHGSYWKAAEYFEKAVELDPLYAEAYASLAYCQSYNYFHRWEDKELIDQAFKNGETALQLDSLSVRAHIFMGNYYSIIPGKSRAKGDAHYKKALTLDPNDFLAHWDYAWRLSASIPEDQEQALKHVNIALNLIPDASKGYWLKSRIIERLKDVELGKELLRDYTALYPDTTGLWYFDAKAEIAAWEHRNYKKKLEMFLDAVKVDSLNWQLYKDIAIMYDYYYNDDRKLVEYAEKAYSLRKERVFHLLSGLYELGDFERAEELMQHPDFVKSPRKDKAGWWVHYYYYKGDYQKALDVIMDSMENTAQTRYLKCLVLIGLGREAEVREILANYWGKGEAIRVPEMATVYAAMGERDSMYHYLNHPEAYFRLNSRGMFDPYRKEPRYREWLRENYLPQPEDTVVYNQPEPGYR